MSGATSVVNAVEHPIATVENAGHAILDVGSSVVSTIGNVAVRTATSIANDATTAATTIAGAAVDAAHTVASGAATLGGEVIHTAGNVLEAGAQAAADLGHTVVNTVETLARRHPSAGDVVHTVGRWSDAVHIVGDVATVTSATPSKTRGPRPDLVQGAGQVHRMPCRP